MLLFKADDGRMAIHTGAPALVKVLKNAPWALRFYQKHGFTFLDAKEAENLKALGITEKPWERILYKKFTEPTFGVHVLH